jgi:nucleoside-diphosphate-sugar epimerase
MKILVSGATGFVGRALIDKLNSNQIYEPIAAVRKIQKNNFFNCPVMEIGELGQIITASPFKNNIDVVVHAAARVHVMKDDASNPLLEFRRVNVNGTLNLAHQASEAGVRRFVFISSIKVNGECTDLGHPFTADQIPMPSDPYGISKYEAEIGLIALAKETGMEVVIVRSPLVYGPGVKANFLSMMNWMRRGIPLPLGGVTKNRRSFVFIDNLVSVVVACINHPAAANQTFLVSDDEDLSTSGLLERMALALGLPSKLMAVPTSLIALGAKLIGRPDISQRLCGSLQVDIRKTKDLLGWSPPVSMDEGLRQTAAHFMKMQS